MSAKQVLFRSQARENVLGGTTHLADAVRITLAQEGRYRLGRLGAPSDASARGWLEELRRNVP